MCSVSPNLPVSAVTISIPDEEKERIAHRVNALLLLRAANPTDREREALLQNTMEEVFLREDTSNWQGNCKTCLCAMGVFGTMVLSGVLAVKLS